MSTRNDPCWCGSGKKWKKCHYPQDATKLPHEQKLLYKKKYNILLKEPHEIAGIRAACQFSAQVLQKLCSRAKAGVTTKELDLFARDLAKKGGSVPACLGYGSPPFPAAICTSLNEVICHGIPNDTPLQEGDILNIDATFMLNGYFGDCSAMVCIGKVSEEKQRVVNVAYECMMRAIQILKPGLLIREIADVIETYAAAHHCSVVNAFVSHGVGLHMHEEPQIPHHYNSSNIPLAPGMTITIEPMINAGVREAVIDPIDGWTARTADHRPSAQWEHSVLITQQGYEILTLP